MSAYGSCSTHGTLSLTSLFPKDRFIPIERVDDARDDDTERECDDDTTACDDHDVTGTNGEVSNADDDDAHNVPDLCDLFE